MGNNKSLEKRLENLRVLLEQPRNKWKITRSEDKDYNGQISISGNGIRVAIRRNDNNYSVKVSGDIKGLEVSSLSKAVDFQSLYDRITNPDFEAVIEKKEGHWIKRGYFPF